MESSSYHFLITKKNKFVWEKDSNGEPNSSLTPDFDTGAGPPQPFLDVFQVEQASESFGTPSLTASASLTQSQYNINNNNNNNGLSLERSRSRFSLASSQVFRQKKKKKGPTTAQDRPLTEEDFQMILEEYGMRKRKIEQSHVSEFFQLSSLPDFDAHPISIRSSDYLIDPKSPAALPVSSYLWFAQPNHFEDSKLSNAWSGDCSYEKAIKFTDLEPLSEYQQNTKARSTPKEIWAQICSVDIPKYQKIYNFRRGTVGASAKRISQSCARELTQGKDAPTESKSVKKQVHEERQRKISEKEEFQRKKKEMEKREMERQQAKLNYLITQTELFSHFMQKKITPEEQSEELIKNQFSEFHQGQSLANQEEEQKLRESVIQTTLRAVSEAKKKQQIFDTQIEKERGQPFQKAHPTPQNTNPQTMNFQNNNNSLQNNQSQNQTAKSVGITESLDTDMSNLVSTPKMFKGALKSYQLRGLSWLSNLYSKGINGILADEMGLGKTVQSISFLAHLAEEDDIWGPFIIIAPVSTVHNWHQEFRKFCPNFKVIPYWGNQAERKIIRKLWNPKKLYRKDSPFHVVITSYNMFLNDEKYFHRVKWQYMILDEAQALKSSSSNRWKTLLSFNCRNRLLLTGTPIQNSMAELWALLHFIMPTLFDSHEEFNEWFSKDIESHAQNQTSLNEHQLSRLHMILKPFMLRRIKRDVEQEIAPKVEKHIPCYLTPRQKKLYRGIKQQISISDLLERSKKSNSDILMNLVMQFRKVCNHPEIFQRSETESPFIFQIYQPLYEFHPSQVVSAVNHNPIAWTIPRLVDEKIMQKSERQLNWIMKNASIWNAGDIYQMLVPSNKPNQSTSHTTSNSAFSFSRFSNMTPSDLVELATGGVYEQWDHHLDQIESWKRKLLVFNDIDPNRQQRGAPVFQLKSQILLLNWQHLLEDAVELLHEHIQATRFFIRCVAAPPIRICSHTSRRNIMLHRLYNQMEAKDLLFCIDPYYTSRIQQANVDKEEDAPLLPDNLYYYQTNEFTTPDDSLKLPKRTGLLENQFRMFGSSQIWVPDYSRLLQSSGKLQMLDRLLKDLKKNGHRVLIYSQMTKMIDILEDFMWFRKYKFLRLDGQSKLSDRRDMVDDWQNKPELFVFLLSTRAGGLGINLTAADTVIFYDSDWNPTVDEQAMDRAHRLGQTKQVNVYRLITSGTIEARILQRAEEKSTIQSLVISGSKSELMPNNQEVMSLLLEEGDMDPALAQNIPLRAISSHESEAPDTGLLEIEGSTASSSVAAPKKKRAPKKKPENADDQPKSTATRQPKKKATKTATGPSAKKKKANNLFDK